MKMTFEEQPSSEATEQSLGSRWTLTVEDMTESEVYKFVNAFYRANEPAIYAPLNRAARAANIPF